MTTDVKDAAPSKARSDGVQPILDNSSKNARVLQASSAFRSPGITDRTEGPFPSLPRRGTGSPQRGGRQQRGQPKGEQRRSEVNSKPNTHQTQPNIWQLREQQKGVQKRVEEDNKPIIRQSQPNPQPRINERRSSVQSMPNLSLRTIDQRENRRGFRGASRSARFPTPRLPIKTEVWAETPGLVTARQSVQRATKIQLEAEKEKLIKGHDQDIDIIKYVSSYMILSSLL